MSARFLAIGGYCTTRGGHRTFRIYVTARCMDEAMEKARALIQARPSYHRALDFSVSRAPD